MKEFMFLSELQKLHDFLTLLVGHEFVIDGLIFVLAEVVGKPPKSKFLFQRKDREYRVLMTLYEMYDGAVSGRALPANEGSRRRLREMLLSSPCISKSQERKIRAW